MSADEAMVRIIEALRTKTWGSLIEPVLSSDQQLAEVQETVRLYVLTRPSTK